MTKKVKKVVEKKGVGKTEVKEKVPYWKTERGRAAARKWRQEHKEDVAMFSRRFRENQKFFAKDMKNENEYLKKENAQLKKEIEKLKGA